MKQTNLKAMIIDADPDQAKAMSIVLKDLFSKIIFQSDVTLALKEFRELKPNILFLNLGIGQRAIQLEIPEKLELTPDEQLVIFGYNDASEPELLATAMESGIHDIFVRPFDADIISTKINRYYVSDKTQNRDLQYGKLTPSLKAQVVFDLKLVAVDENGFTFKGEHFICKGTTFPLKGTFIKDIFEADIQEFMITKTWVNEDQKDYYLYAEPRDMKEQTNAALRRFILRQL
jgi:DNA-binding response OmpR family regulator